MLFVLGLKTSLSQGVGTFPQTGRGAGTEWNGEPGCVFLIPQPLPYTVGLFPTRRLPS